VGEAVGEAAGEAAGEAKPTVGKNKIVNISSNLNMQFYSTKPSSQSNKGIPFCKVIFSIWSNKEGQDGNGSLFRIWSFYGEIGEGGGVKIVSLEDEGDKVLIDRRSFLGETL